MSHPFEPSWVSRQARDVSPVQRAQRAWVKARRLRFAKTEQHGIKQRFGTPFPKWSWKSQCWITPWTWKHWNHHAGMYRVIGLVYIVCLIAFFAANSTTMWIDCAFENKPKYFELVPTNPSQHTQSSIPLNKLQINSDFSIDRVETAANIRKCEQTSEIHVCFDPRRASHGEMFCHACHGHMKWHILICACHPPCECTSQIFALLLKRMEFQLVLL